MRTFLEQTGLKAFRGSAPGPTDPPYLIFIDDAPTNTGADNRVIYSQKHTTVEYVWSKKSSDTEAAIEAVLNQSYYWTKSEDTYIESENLWVTYYYI